MTVMVFGVFDGLHAGHKAFLREAHRLTIAPSAPPLTVRGGRGEIVVVVARDSSVLYFKHKTPRHDEQERITMIRDFMPDATVVLGDIVQGNYEVIKTNKPDMICLGHDQHALGDDLRQKIAAGTLPNIIINELPKL